MESGDEIPTKKQRVSRPLQQLSQTSPNHNSTSNYRLCREAALSQLPSYHDFVFSGTLKRVELINFMCHAHFAINFNPRINFISGCNGSGKSAIQTAIVVGLGGVASKTNRSNNISGLIKQGCSFGDIIITLSNNGENAYKPDIYHGEIKIVRHITLSSSTYKLCNQQGKHISNKKKDLDQILSHFGIQPNNPVAILNQDTARNFLHTNSPQTKYNLFRVAIKADVAEQYISELKTQLAEQKQESEKQQKILGTLERNIQEIVEKIKIMKTVEEYKVKVDKLELESRWSQIQLNRQELTKLEGILLQQERVKQSQEEQIKETEQLVEQKQTEYEHLKEILKKIDEESRDKEEVVQNLRKEQRIFRNKCNEKAYEYSSLVNEFKNKDADKQILQKTIEDAERIENQMACKKLQTSNNIKACKMKEAKLEQQLQSKEQLFIQFQNELNVSKDQVKDCEKSILSSTRKINELKEHLRGFDSEPSNPFLKYGPWMSELVQKVEEAAKRGRFSEPPRGPLGHYISVKDTYWTDAIESSFGYRFLHSFFVNSIEDENLLLKIMESVRGMRFKPMIYRSVFDNKEHDYKGRETLADGHTNIMRAVDIRDLPVKNLIRDVTSFHTTLLMKDEHQCREFVSHDSHLPPNCRKILNPRADRYLPGFRMYSNTSFRKATILLPEQVDQRALFENRLKEETQSLERLNCNLRMVKQKYREGNDAVNKINDEINMLRLNLSQNKRIIVELQAELELELPSKENQLAELKELEMELSQLRNKVVEVNSEKTELNSKMKEIEEQLQSLSTEDILSKQTEVNNEMRSVQSHIQALRQKIELCGRSIDEQILKIQRLNPRIDKLKEEWAEHEPFFAQYSDQFSENARLPSDVNEERDRLLAFIEEATERLGSDFNVYASNYEEEAQKCEEKKIELEESNKALRTLKEMLRFRVQVFENLINTHSDLLSAHFQQALSCRNYSGMIKLDHNKKTLDILMKPLDGGDTMLLTESLSGGEKSVSTVGFIMALWTNMDLPFYSMDEYDVFMDPINRRAVTEFIMSFATEKSRRQFVFLTPLDVSIIKPGPTVEVHKILK